MTTALTKRQKLDILEAEMRLERQSWKSSWQELSQNILPRRSRFFISDVNKGERRNLDIIDATATLASRTLSAGMMTGITSPARPWFKLGVNDFDLRDSVGVKAYLKIVEERQRSTFLKTNLYRALPVVYGDLGTYANACMFMEEDAETVMNFTVFPVGSYMIGLDHKGRVRVFLREFQMSVRQIVEKFGLPDTERPKDIDWTNISESVKNLWERDQRQVMVDVNHVVLPNDDYDPRRVQSKFKKYASLYYERGIASASNFRNFHASAFDKFLSEKGFDYFPVLAPRWEVAGEDTYGSNCPGMIAIGDVKQLQLGEKRIANALDQKVKPAMVGPTSLKNAKASILPGDITYLDEREGTRGFRRLFEVDFDIRELDGKQDQIRGRISRAYYEDLFLMLANTTRRQITAREIEERHEEKLLALGPVLERINQDLLDPLIENSYFIMNKQGKLPPPPQELEGRDFEVEYISIMAQAQKLAGIGSIERFIGYVGQVAQLDPSSVNTVDFKASIRNYGDAVGVDPSLVRSAEAVEEIEEAQAQAARQQQALEQAGQLANAGKTLSQTKINEDNALSQILQGVSA